MFLVPSQLPLRPLRERGEREDDQDACVLYLDFHGLLRRLLPTLIPRLCANCIKQCHAEISPWSWCLVI